jgi:hypothetical protein
LTRGVRDVRANHQGEVGRDAEALRSMFGVAKGFRELQERLIDR